MRSERIAELMRIAFYFATHVLDLLKLRALRFGLLLYIED